VYAIVPASQRAGGRGLEGERLRVVKGGSIAAVVGESKRRRAASALQLVTYDRLLHQLAGRSASVVPVRFGTFVADEEELRFVLRTRRLSLHRALAHVRNRAQMTVRLAIERSGDAASSTRVSGPVRRLSGTTYLRARAKAAADAGNLAEFGPLRAAVARWIRDERIERRGRLATVYHLIPRGSAAAYRRALARAMRRHGVPVAVSGPWVPYAFSVPEEGQGG
jgi:hypothetical protein